MIRVVKKFGTCPTVLTTKGTDRTSSVCTLFNKWQAKYLSGKKKMPEVSGSIYRHSTVVDVLMEAQRNKCCYCERCREDVELDVEHYRPKGAVQQHRGGEVIHPGYYWLAYDWDNLFLSCKRCNSKWKSILFPLADPLKRARSHNSTYKVTDERPLFINPGKENPRNHIRFRNDAPYATTKKGQITIEELGLLADKRPSLREARLERLKDLRIYCELLKLADIDPANTDIASVAANARRRLKELSGPSAEFSSMAKDYIKDYGITL